MLPNEILERLTGSHGFRSDHRTGERRGATRIPARCAVMLHGINGGKLGPPVPVRVRDISATGIAFVTPPKMELGGEFVVKLTPPSGAAVWLWCASTRRNDFTRTVSVQCGAFLKLLSPTQTLAPGKALAEVVWHSVEGDDCPVLTSAAKRSA
jgi:hypothetical protein